MSTIDTPHNPTHVPNDDNGPNSWGDYFTTPPDFSALYVLFEELADVGLVRFTTPTTVEIVVPRRGLG